MKDKQLSSKRKGLEESTKNTGAGSFVFMGTVYDVHPKYNAVDVDGDGRKSLFGQVDLWDSCIRYYAKRKKAEVRKTMVHEWFHLIVDWIRSETLSPSEQDIDQLAELWYAFLKDNNLWNNDAWVNVIPTEKDDEWKHG